MSNNKPCLYPRTLSELKEKYGDRCQISGSYRVKAILDVKNECCPDLPVLLTSVSYENGKEVFSAQCACGKIATRGCSSPEEAKELFHHACVSASKEEKKNSDFFLRLHEGLHDYFLTEPDEVYVRVDVYFLKADGQEQGKRYEWRSPKYSQELPGQRSLVRARDILEGKG